MAEREYTTAERRSVGQPVIQEINLRDRVAWCGRMVNRRCVPRDVDPTTPPLPGVAWHATEDRRHVRATRLTYCADAWSCPDCWTCIAMHYASVVTEAVVNVQANGGCALLVVLTLPHTVRDRLADLWSWLRAAWHWMTHRDGWRDRVCRSFGVTAWASSTECPYSLRTGYHPHENVVLLLPDRPTMTAEDLDVIEGRLYVAWQMALRAVGCDRDVSVDHGISVTLVDDALDLGAYLFKHVGLEFLSPSGVKDTRGDSVECRDLPLAMADAAGARRVRDVARTDPTVARWVDAWSEYREVRKGQVFRHSEGFYRWVTCDPMSVQAIRKNAARLQVDDRVRVDAAVARLAAARGVVVPVVPDGPDGPTGDDPHPPADDVAATADDPDVTIAAPEPADAEPDTPPIMFATEQAFLEAQAAYDHPTTRGGPAPVPELLRCHAARLSFVAAVCSVIRRWGPRRAAALVVSAMARPPQVWFDARGTVVLAYHQHDPTWVSCTDFSAEPMPGDLEEAA